MTVPSLNNHKPRAARSPDKRSLKSREDRSELVLSTAANSPLWVGDVKASGENLILAGLELAAGEALVQSLRTQMESAEKQLLSLTIAWDERFNLYAGNAEVLAVKPQDITNLALPLLEETTNKLAPPVSVSARFDVLAGLIRLLVRKPPGNFACRIEVSPNPITPTSWVAVKGKGARRALSGYPSGGLWIRALLSDNENESDYSQPVFVMVP
jgi:hypothetical protein